MHVTIVAVLERKGILSREEGEKLTEFINNKPQPHQLGDALEQISEFIEAPKGAKPGKPNALPQATNASTTAGEADEIDKAVAGDSKKSGEK